MHPGSQSHPNPCHHAGQLALASTSDTCGFRTPQRQTLDSFLSSWALYFLPHRSEQHARFFCLRMLFQAVFGSVEWWVACRVHQPSLVQDKAVLKSCILIQESAAETAQACYMSGFELSFGGYMFRDISQLLNFFHNPTLI